MTTIDPQRDNSDNNNNPYPTKKKIIVKPDRFYRFPNPRPEPDRVTDSERCIFGDRELGNTHSPVDEKLLEEWRKNAEYGSHYAATPIEDEGKYFRDQPKEYDNSLRGYEYDSSNILILGIVVEEKKRLNNRSKKKKQLTRAKTYTDPILDGPSLQELAVISAEVKYAHDNIIGEVEEKRRAKIKDHISKHPQHKQQQSSTTTVTLTGIATTDQRIVKKKTKKELEEELQAEMDAVFNNII